MSCDVLVGGESTGVHPSILANLRPGVDRVVYVPMAGFHKSMNVAQAVTGVARCGPPTPVLSLVNGVACRCVESVHIYDDTTPA